MIIIFFGVSFFFGVHTVLVEVSISLVKDSVPGERKVELASTRGLDDNPLFEIGEAGVVMLIRGLGAPVLGIRGLGERGLGARGLGARGLEADVRKLGLGVPDVLCGGVGGLPGSLRVGFAGTGGFDRIIVNL